MLSGEGDFRTRHAGCPVLVGTKWGKCILRVFSFFAFPSTFYSSLLHKLTTTITSFSFT